MSKKATIYDIASKLNITAATVSRALNNSKLISEKTRKLVLKTAEELNYNKNKHALALKSGQTYVVGLVVPTINRHFFSNVIRGVEETLYPKGYQVMIFQTNESEKREEEIIETLLNNQVDGIIISLSKKTTSDAHFRKVVNSGTPLIFFDRKFDTPGTSSITLDDYTGGILGTQHLIDQNRKRIAFVSGDLKLGIYKNRFDGYKSTLGNNNIPFDKELVFEATSDIASGKKVAKKILNLPKIPNAVFCSSDYVALGVIQHLQSLKVRIPDEIAVVGFSNEPFTSLLELSITSIEQNPIVMGESAARIFLEKVNNKDVVLEQSAKLKPELLVRKSSQILKS